jgi:anti-anti-sigma regulatory factor
MSEEGRIIAVDSSSLTVVDSFVFGRLVSEL